MWNGDNAAVFLSQDELYEEREESEADPEGDDEEEDKPGPVRVELSSD